MNAEEKLKKYHNEYNRKYYKKRSKEDPRINIFRNARRRSSESGITFNISLDDIVIPEICPYLGITLKAGNGKQCDSSPSLDRVNPLNGYIKDNIEVISNKANQIKNNGTSLEHYKIANRMSSLEDDILCCY